LQSFAVDFFLHYLLLNKNAATQPREVQNFTQKVNAFLLL